MVPTTRFSFEKNLDKKKGIDGQELYAKFSESKVDKYKFILNTHWKWIIIYDHLRPSVKKFL